MIWKYVLLWFGLVIVAILNGLLRQKVTLRYTGELTAHQLSTLTFILLTGTYVWLFSLLWPLETAGQAWTIGAIWLLMTIVFEFIFGHFVMKHSWEKLFHDYNILKGRLWIIVLVWTVILPWIFFVI